jgi:hypothetical protein
MVAFPFHFITKHTNTHCSLHSETTDIATNYNDYFHISALEQYPFRYLYGVDVFYYFTDDRTPWTTDELVARSLPKHRLTETLNKHINIPDIHTLCGIRTHDPGFRSSEDSTCVRPLGYRDRLRTI